MTNLSQVVKDLYSAFERQDVPGMLSLMTDDVVLTYEAPAEIPLSGVWCGKQGAINYLAQLAKHQSDTKLAITEFFEKENEVITMGRVQFTLQATGVRVDTPLVQYYIFSDGKINRVFQFANTGLVVEGLRGRADANTA